MVWTHTWRADGHLIKFMALVNKIDKTKPDELESRTRFIDVVAQDLYTLDQNATLQRQRAKEIDVERF